MTYSTRLKHSRNLLTLCALLLSLFCFNTQASPGHDHDEPTTAVAGQPLPAVIAVSESFELVGRLSAAELSILIDHRDSNLPVLGAKLNVEVDEYRATAAFHEDHGDYALTDANILARLRQPPQAAITFTLVTRQESDLLVGSLDIPVEQAPAQRAAETTPPMPGKGVVLALAAALIATAIAIRQRRHTARLAMPLAKKGGAR